MNIFSVQHEYIKGNIVQEKDRIARKGAMLPDGGAILPDGYITSI